MLRKELIFIFLSVWLLSCGNSGNLYLSDEAKIAETTDATEIARLRARANRFAELERLSLQLKAEMTRLRSQGKKDDANTKYIAYKETRQEMGQIILQRQQESKYGNF